MIQLPNCPCCDMDDLWLRSMTLENGHWHYYVECGSCGMEFHHEDFYGYNQVMKFFEDSGRESCENHAPFVDDGEQLEWKCSICGKERVTKEGEPPYSFCPDCGAEVTEW